MMIDFYIRYDANWCGATVHCDCLVVKIKDSDAEAMGILDQLIQHSALVGISPIREVTRNEETLGLFDELVEHLKPVQ